MACGPFRENHVVPWPWLMYVYACECVLEALHVCGHTSRPRRSLPELSSETQSLRPGPRAWLPLHRLARPIGHSPSCRIPRWCPLAPPSPLSVHSSRDAPAAEHSGWGAAGRWPAPLRGPWGAGQAAPVPTQALLGVSVPLGPELPVRGGWSPGEGQQWGCSPLPSAPTLRMGLG